MALTFTKEPDMATWKSDRRLYLTEDGQVVEEGDERAATLLVGEGGELSAEDAKRYGVTLKAVKDATAEPVQAEQPADDEQAAKADDATRQTKLGRTARDNKAG
jgi:hypothetical protein